MTRAYSMRDYLLQKLFWNSGLRNKEAGNLLVNNMDFKKCEGYVREGKGGNPRYFSLDLVLVDEL